MPAMSKRTASSMIELAAAAVAAASLGGAVLFAVERIAPAGAGVLHAAACGALAAIAVWTMILRIDRNAERGAPFVAASLDPVDGADEVMGDRRDDGEDVLLLDDPLPALGEESRVVRLFATQEAVPAAAPFAGPGDMVARIENFLGHARSADGEPARRANVPSDEASAALHAALADIRRSLRQG